MSKNKSIYVIKNKSIHVLFKSIIHNTQMHEIVPESTQECSFSEGVALFGPCANLLSQGLSQDYRTVSAASICALLPSTLRLAHLQALDLSPSS